MALHFGADDIDGTIVEERIMHAAGAQTSRGISKQQMIKLIKEAYPYRTGYGLQYCKTY